MIINKLITELGGETPKLVLNEMLLNFEELAKTSHPSVIKFQENYINNIVESLNDLTIDDDESESLASLPSIWLEMRLEWNRYNNQMQYQTIVRGMANPELMAKGASLSYLLGIIEKYLSNDDIFWSQRLASGAIQAIRGGIQLNHNFLNALDLNHVSKAMSTAASFKNSEINTSNFSNFEAVLSETLNKIQNNFQISSNDLHRHLELIVAEQNANAKFKIIFTEDDSVGGVLLNSGDVTTIKNFMNIWLAEIIANPKLLSDEFQHYNLSWKLAQLDGVKIVHFADNTERSPLSLFKDIPFREEKKDGMNFIEIYLK